MRTLIANFLAALIFSALAAPSSAEVYRCQIGKPSYCFKYGGSRCEATNRAPDKAAACAKWSSACVECHNEIPDCLGGVRPASNDPSCTKCSKKWQACMQRIDRRFWPNRLN